MSLKIKGRIITALPEVSGVAKNGNPWRKREYVLETEGQYPKKVAFSVMGDKIENLNLAVGQSVEVNVDIESREYNGRWYTSVSAYASTPIQAAQPQAPVQPQAQAQPQYNAPAPPPPYAGAPAGAKDDDLPF